MTSFKKFFIIIFVILASGGLILAGGLKLRAETDTEELRTKIEERNRAITELEKEIESYQNQINKIGDEAKTLQNHIKSLNLSVAKLNKDIQVTENKISSAGYSISQLGLEIKHKEEQIDFNSEAVAKMLRNVDKSERESLVELILNYERLSDVWNAIEAVDQFNRQVKDKIIALNQVKDDLEGKKQVQENQKNELNRLKKQLSSQKSIVAENKKEKDNLLKTTKNTEANYKKILEEKVAKKEEFEQELFEFESRLQIAIDPNRLPSVGSGVLKWPLDLVKITQYFGNTAFATRNPQIYRGKGHTGVDFRASIGTRVRSARTGVVEGVGDTDQVRGCYSYGKWALITHDNGLSTLYAHLSLISVSIGQSVGAGDTIGYSGNSGYSTGPHLHFSVYATQGVKIIRYDNSKNCRNALIPVADPKAYLNPLSYL